MNILKIMDSFFSIGSKPSKVVTCLLILVLGGMVFQFCSSTQQSGFGGVKGRYLNSGDFGKTTYFRVPGMVYVPTGSMLIGSNDDGIFGNFFALKNRQVTISGFWMDETETTNSSYRGFVTYTHDSVIATVLRLYRGSGTTAAGKSSQKTATTKVNDSKGAKGRKPVTTNVSANTANTPTKPTTTASGTTQSLSSDSLLDYAAVHAALQDIKHLKTLREKGFFYYDAVLKTYRPNFQNISYRYYAFSLAKFANETTEGFDESKLESNYVLKAVKVIPDTTVWVKDLSYSYNEPMAMRYYSAINYSNYPVVGVTWDQAKAFCNWRTDQTKVQLMSNPKIAALAFDAHFRLPTESEWEYAARGGRSTSLYPWGGPYTTNKFGCFLANFKNQRGVYVEDGFAYTCDVRTYFPNDFGLYCMAGNVAEWTESVYSDDGYVYFSDINPSLSDVDLSVNGGKLVDEQKKVISARKVVKGGSWKDVAAFIQNGYRTTENKDNARSYIGFRSVIDLPPSSF